MDQQTKDTRQARSHLRRLIADVKVFLVRLDIVMSQPSDVMRGRKIAALANDLDLARQIASRFGLPPRKKRAAT